MVNKLSPTISCRPDVEKRYRIDGVIADFSDSSGWVESMGKANVLDAMFLGNRIASLLAEDWHCYG
ncbi:hypothetical protein [Coleofasciculus sp. H7-2]|uniref:hypothetical protein n=1 Tax=Coleofasciculus sp. H7-2 TaxID=3351545 RepID=UPI00366FD592